jgi:hypothetical protein
MKFLPHVLTAGIIMTAAVARAETSTNAADPQLWFPVGEKIVYRLYWGMIPVGAAEISSEWQEREGKKYILLKSVARTTAIVAKIYPVNDKVESLVDPATFLPVEYTQSLREGRHSRDDKVKFDYGKNIAHWEKADGSKKADVAITNDTRDVLCLYYFMRAKGFETGQKSWFGVFVDNKIYSLVVEGLGEKKIDLDKYGKVDCLELEPKAKFGEIFVRKGKIRLWFSKDSRHICARMSAKVPLASVHAYLVDVQGPGDDMWIKASDVESDKPVQEPEKPGSD